MVFYDSPVDIDFGRVLQLTEFMQYCLQLERIAQEGRQFLQVSVASIVHTRLFVARDVASTLVTSHGMPHENVVHHLCMSLICLFVFMWVYLNTSSVWSLYWYKFHGWFWHGTCERNASTGYIPEVTKTYVQFSQHPNGLIFCVSPVEQVIAVPLSNRVAPI